VWRVGELTGDPLFEVFGIGLPAGLERSTGGLELILEVFDFVMQLVYPPFIAADCGQPLFLQRPRPDRPRLATARSERQRRPRLSRRVVVLISVVGRHRAQFAILRSSG
jgi:hypothetical protein